MKQNVIDLYLQRHESFLNQILAEFSVPAPKIKEAIRYSLFPGGKRIRPLLVYLSGDLLGVNLKTLDVIAAAIELTHCYSLIHDDLPAMDDDDYRRGRLSCHKQFDEATAILAGDGLQALAIEILLEHLTEVSAEQKIQITQILLRASGIQGMVSGQSLDLSELKKANLDESMLINIHSLKTGCLISACFEMVLAAQTPTESQISIALRTYAQHLGLVFQMQDDYLDAYAVNTLGKSRASDLANAKTTFARLYSKEHLNQKINNYFISAIHALKGFEERATPLIDLTQSLHHRSNPLNRS